MAHDIIKPSFVRTDERGTLTEVLNSGHWESILTGTMKPGAIMGNHYHKETLIFFYLTQGEISVKTVHVETGARDAFELHDGEGVILHTDESHAITFLVESSFMLLKSKQYDPQNRDTYDFPVE